MTRDDEMDLQRYLRVVWHQRWIILACAIVGALGGLVFAKTQTPRYEATAAVLVEDGPSASVLDPNSQRDPASEQQQVQTEMGILRSRSVRDVATKDLGFDTTIRVAEQGTSLIVEVAATDTSKRRAVDIVNAYAQAYVEVRRERTIDDLNAAIFSLHQRRDEVDDAVATSEQAVEDLTAQRDAASPEDRPDLEAELTAAQQELDEDRQNADAQRAVLNGQIGQLQSATTLAVAQGPTIVSKATASSDPVSPKPARDAALGLVLGLAVGLALAFLRDHLDDTIRTVDDLGRIDVPVLGMIPTTPAREEATPVISVGAPRSAAAEAYRALRVAVQMATVDRDLVRLLVTSPSESDGKSTTAANLAVAVAASGTEVALVDADLRRPRQHVLFGLDPIPGLTTVIVGDERLESALRPIEDAPRLSVLPAGPLAPSAAELLGATSTTRVFEDLARSTSLCIVDSPPVLPVADAMVLAGTCDAVVLVVSVGSTTKRALARAIERLSHANAMLAGIVVNRAGAGDAYAYAYGANQGSRWRPRRPKVLTDARR